jgi:hypothetical protein
MPITRIQAIHPKGKPLSKPCEGGADEPGVLHSAGTDDPSDHLGIGLDHQKRSTRSIRPNHSCQMRIKDRWLQIIGSRQPLQIPVKRLAAGHSNSGRQQVACDPYIHHASKPVSKRASA